MKPAALVHSLVCLLATIGSAAAEGPAPAQQAIRVYAARLDPREHPDYERRAVKPPTWDTFRNRTQFTTLRGFNVEHDRITGFEEELEKYTRTHELGDVIWPSYPILFATNLTELAEAIQRRGLYLFDVWGYVPGSGPGGYWQQFRPPPEAFAVLESKLGERWLGTDIGEQDGRYIGGYANQMTPASGDRLDQYLNFQRHFERMGDDLGHKHATLVSLNFGHYFLKEGTYTLIGAETAQALPNSQVYYAFIRGAGKQYGVPWFGNASVFNRWGFKTYGSSGKSDGYEFGPTQGSSLSLLKRLLYSHLLYNCVAVGFENMWFEGGQLSPIGRIQQAAQRWVKQHGQPGTMHTPVALLLDFNCGWSFPRHLYTDKLFRVWGNLPFEEGDHLTDAILDLLYPGYADASYFHDESGFLTATPFGDIADCLLSDAPLWLLQRYPVLVLAGELRGSVELWDKLEAYVASGGHIVAAAGTLARMPGLFGRTPQTTDFVRETGFGQGRVTVLETRFGLVPNAPYGGRFAALDGFGSGIDKPLPRPYRLQDAGRAALERIFRQVRLFEVDAGLQLITCRKRAGEYTLGVFNNTWKELPLRIVSNCGSIRSVRELTIDSADTQAEGYLPRDVDPVALGRNSETTIAGGDVRLFAVTVTETNVAEIAHVKPPPRPSGRFLTLRNPASLKEAILARPTFFEHFDGVVLDWRYLHTRERSALAAEAPWLRRQGLRVVVDLSSGINLYPTLRLLNNVEADFRTSTNAIVDTLSKMEILGARDLLLCLHRHPENNLTGEQTDAGLVATLKELAGGACAADITVHLRLAPGRPPWSLEEAFQWLERVGAPNLRLAPSVALLAGRSPTPETQQRLGEVLGFWLVAAPELDLAGHLWNAHGRLSGFAQPEQIQAWLGVAGPQVPCILDAALSGPDEEYGEAKALESLMAGALRVPGATR